jgi:hypothetical protein
MSVTANLLILDVSVEEATCHVWSTVLGKWENAPTELTFFLALLCPVSPTHFGHVENSPLSESHASDQTQSLFLISQRESSALRGFMTLKQAETLSGGEAVTTRPFKACTCGWSLGGRSSMQVKVPNKLLRLQIERLRTAKAFSTTDTCP